MASVPSPPAALARPASSSPAAMLRSALSRLAMPGIRPAATTVVAATPPLGNGDLPGSGPGGEGCAALLGGAVALSSLYDASGAHDAAARAAILSHTTLAARLASSLHGANTPLFAGEFVHLAPFWQAAVVTVLDHPTLAAAQPATIGGFPAHEVLRAAIALAMSSPPFDKIVPSLERLATIDPDAAP